MASEWEERRRRYLAARDAALRSLLEPGETVAVAGPFVLLTDQRIVFTSVLDEPRGGRGEVLDALGFEDVRSWSRGRLHDRRPVLRLDHVPHTRIEWIPRHRVLWFRWGNASGPIVHHHTTLSFNRDSDPELLAVVEQLRTKGIPEREPFEITLQGTREHRKGERATLGVAYAGPAGWFGHPGGRLLGWEGRLYAGSNIAWRVRLASWLLLAIPAWFLTPWLVVPAIALAELAWVVGLRWSAHRDRSRRAISQ